jgi:predicted methyltransferase
LRRAPIVAVLMAASLSLASAATAPPGIVAAAVADPSRPKTDTDADHNRKPAETLTFAGVEPGMAVGEFFPGGGYFTRMLGKLVGSKGHVYGIENAGWKDAVKADDALVAGGAMPNVSIEALPFGTVRFPKPLDLVWVTQNYHDLKIAQYGQVDMAAFNRAVFNSL